MEAPSVYFIQVQEPDGKGGPIKIGCSLNPRKRLSSLLFWCPYPLSIIATAPGCRIAEAAIHERFAQHRIHGEWFRPAEEIAAFARAVGIGGSLPNDIPNTVGAQFNSDGLGRSSIADVLRKAGLSLRELAKGMGVPPATANHWPHFLPEHRAVQIASYLTSIGIPTTPFDLFARRVERPAKRSRRAPSHEACA